MLGDWRLLTSYQNKRRPLAGPLNASLHASAVWGAHSGSRGSPRLTVEVDVGVAEVWIGQEHYLCLSTIVNEILRLMVSQQCLFIKNCFTDIH